MLDILKEILISEKEVTKTNYERLEKNLVGVKKKLIDSEGSMYLTVDSLIELNNIITSSNIINLRKINLNPYGFDKMYKDKDLIENKLYQIIDQFNENKITHKKFYLILLNEIYPFYDGNDRTCKIQLVNNETIKLIDCGFKKP